MKRTIKVSLKDWLSGDFTAIRFFPEEDQEYFNMPMMLGVELAIRSNSSVSRIIFTHVFPFNPAVSSSNLQQIDLIFDKKGLLAVSIDEKPIPLESIAGVRIVVHTSTAVFVLRKTVPTSKAWDVAVWNKRTSTALLFAFVEMKNLFTKFRQLNNAEKANGEFHEAN